MFRRFAQYQQRIIGRSLLGLLLLCLPLVSTLKAEPSTIRYIDADAGFLLLDQISSEVKNGDKVCVFETKEKLPTCDAVFRFLSKSPLLFPSKELLERVEVGTVIDIKKIYFNGRGLDTQPDVLSYNKNLLESREKDQKVDATKADGAKNKFPKGAPPDLSVEAPAIEGDDFPDILVPKLRKTRKKTKREITDMDITIKSIKKAVKDKGLVKYAFVADPVVEDVLPKTVREDYPNPLSGALEISALQVMPIQPMATYQSLSFKTITNQTTKRSSLWNLSRNKLIPSAGGGIDIQLSSKQASFFNFGWRYHVYNSLKSRSTFDEFDTSLIAKSSSRVGEQIVSADWGKRQTWTDNFFSSYAFGLDLAYTDVNFQSHYDGNGTTPSTIIATARHKFLTIAPRSQLRVGVQRWGFGFSLGALIIVPAFDFRDEFTGTVAVPDRITFSGSPENDLQKSLAQKRNPVSAEIFISVSYQPQRK